MQISTLRSSVSACPTSSNAITTTAAPYLRTNFACSIKISSPSFNEMAFTIGLPCTDCKPASITSHLDESIITGTLAASGSVAIMLRKRVMHFLLSSKASSMFTSITCAPFFTWSMAISMASANLSSLIKRLNFAEPVTLLRSPTFTNRLSSSMLSGSKPDKRMAVLICGNLRGGMFSTASAKALMCSGVVPQQPPIMFTKPLSAHSLRCAAMSSAPRS